jgi:carbon storage regulator
MLALTRKKGESIIIGDNIEVIVLSVQGDMVKIGVEAPRSIPVNRKEIFVQILEQNRRAAERPVSVQDISNLFKIMQERERQEKEQAQRRGDGNGANSGK